MIVFDKDFKFGVSISGFQFEMGVSQDSIDKNSDWFLWVHDALNIGGGIVSGDLPENGPGYWDLYEKDHEIMSNLGLGIVRIGIEWSRIFPNSTESISVNIEKNDQGDIVNIDIKETAIEKLKEFADKNALSHYKKVITDLKNRGFTVMVNLNHFTLPLWIHNPVNVQRYKDGPYGWIDKKTVIEFVKYAGFLTRELSDTVDYWSTMNEPQIVSSLGYLQPKAGFPPGVLNFDWYLLAQKNEAEAHVRAYDVMKKFTDKPIGIIYSFTPYTPLAEDDKDVLDNAMYFSNWHFMDMIVYGMIDDNLDGKKRERKDMKGKLDFIGVNYYTRMMAQRNEKNRGIFNWSPVWGYGYACNGLEKSLSGRPVTDMGWEIYPEGIRDITLSIKERYGDMPMFITENGVGEYTGKYIPYFIVSHLKSLHDAISNGAKIKAYMYWSFMDNYEWASGFSKRFGLLGINLQTKMRIPKPGYFIYREIIKEHGIPDWMLEYVKDPYKLL